MNLTNRALALAATGLPVFPVTAKKAPAIPKSEGGKGFRDASTDPATIRKMFATPGAVHIGMPTGAVSGIDVLDLDYPKGADQWERSVTLPATRMHKTGGGGRHYLFRHADGLGCSVERIAPGVDVRADSGYVIWWPVCDASEIAEWPDWLLAAARGTPARGSAEVSHLEPPPNAAAVIDLLTRLPNPASNSRDVWVDVMLAATGCVFALEAAEQSSDGIAAAACEWAARWPGSLGYDAEMSKWESDWSRRDRPLAGWRNLCRRGCADIPGYAVEQAVAEFAAVPLPPEPLVRDCPPPVRGHTMRERFVFPADCETGDRRGYTVKHLVAPGDVAAIIGPPGCGKSMLAPYLAYRVAQGRHVFGMRTKQGRTLYVAAEDARGMRQRVHALKLTHGDAPDFAMVDVGSLRDAATVADLMAAVTDWKPVMVVIDTLGAAFAGMDENSAADMGEVVALARKLSGQGCAVILIHHIAKHGDGSPRGHSVLNGTLDMSLSLAPRGEDGVVRGAMLKNRNGTTDRTIAFRFVAVELGEDDDGDKITAPMAVELDPDEQRAAPPKLSPTDARAIDILRVLIDGQGVDVPGGQRRVPEQAWRDACEDQRLSPADLQDSRNRVVRRTISALLSAKRVEAGGGMFWITGQGADRQRTSPDKRRTTRTMSAHHFDAVPDKPDSGSIDAGLVRTGVGGTSEFTLKHAARIEL